MEVSIDSTPKGLPSFDALFESALEEEGRCSKTLSLSNTSKASSSVDFFSMSLSSQGSGLGLTPQPSGDLSDYLKHGLVGVTKDWETLRNRIQGDLRRLDRAASGRLQDMSPQSQGVQHIEVCMLSR
ncbi:hypothetical protein CVIRNUC_007128 [Coccomyxa viridis]|uniref:Uncharacterized protein n=1 Tax=Coccomyxa viridis TaxID=1274662 RepID=A0AAV1ICF9_9CHLO|nr:hypothetical protein CVIRNUC_007128 [Coccomyxa viridis]